MAATKEKDVNEIFHEMSLLNYTIGSHFYAQPTHLVDPHDFFIIPYPLLYHLRKLSQIGKPLTITEVKEKNIVIYKSRNPDVNKYLQELGLDENIRGVVQSISDDNKCQIFALDRGFVENDVTIDRLYQPACQEALTIPSLVQHCELFFCAPIGQNFSKESIDAFKFFMGNEKLSVVIKGTIEDKLSILVYNSNLDDVATTLALTHYTYLVGVIRNDLDSLSINHVRPKLTYRHKVLQLDEILTVRVQSGADLKEFYVTPVSDYKEYLKERPNFTSYCKSVKEISDKDFKRGSLVGVYDDWSFSYERGVILEVDDEKAKVKLVDWGTEKMVYKDNLKAVKSELYVESPVKAIFCSAVEDFVPWDNGLSGFLYKGYTFLIKVKKVGKEFDMPHVVAIAQA